MKFGSVPIDRAAGGIVAHAVRRPGLTLKKGDTVSAADVEALRAAGVQEVTVAQLEAGDIGEDEAAALLARKLSGANLRIDPPFTGRCNIFATSAGVLLFDGPAIDAVNALDEAITFATLPALRAVVEGEMVATVKIIPFAVARDTLDKAMATAGAARLSVEPFKPMKVAMISTVLPGLKPSTIDKTARILEQRLAPAGARIVSHECVEHDAQALVAVLRGLDVLLRHPAVAVAVLVRIGEVHEEEVGRLGGEVLGRPARDAAAQVARTLEVIDARPGSGLAM